ncbi:carbohydrate sulfotransferase 15-like [Saccostrea echinata]|uniref:carbohydrate sulfotransferase 15-like n=1 Tax=Saccostrea echinata TaxID=191078 RepID=UPI002A82DA08|nr:carbohydrate sulfotransferase 15-like [Saccostrea echinata]
MLCFFGSFSVLYMFFHTDVKRKLITPSIESLFLHNVDVFTEEVPGYYCPSNIEEDAAEDILCMERKQFLKNYKNPCWLQEIDDYGSYPVQTELRCFPYFHIFGVCKTGTTDLFFRLTQHPQILNNFGLLNKETWYWSWRRYGQATINQTKITLDEFSMLFSMDKMRETKTSLDDWSQYSDLITGHGDPMDFWDHSHWREIPQNAPYSKSPKFLTPHLVKHVQPNIKLILLLREPAERLYSHYYHGRYGRTSEEFHHDVITGIQVLNECLSFNSFKTCLYGHDITQLMRLPLSASLYYIHLKEWLDVFPREQIFILRNEDYQKDMKYSLLKLFAFLGVGDIPSNLLNEIIKMPHKYETKRKQNQGSMLNETWEILTDFFEEPNRKLAAMLNDERYLWKDTEFKFRPKKLQRIVRKIRGDDHLRRYYERKKNSELNPKSMIDRFIMSSNSYEEWVAKVKKYQEERLKTYNSNKRKKPDRTFHREKLKMNQPSSLPFSPSHRNHTFQQSKRNDSEVLEVVTFSSSTNSDQKKSYIQKDFTNTSDTDITKSVSNYTVKNQIKPPVYVGNITRVRSIPTRKRLQNFHRRRKRRERRTVHSFKSIY